MKSSQIPFRGREDIRTDTLFLLGRLADDWEYSGVITEDTRLLADMGFESLDVVILSAQVQEHFGRVLPFTEFFNEIGQRERKDISVGEWVDFVFKHLNTKPTPTSMEEARP